MAGWAVTSGNPQNSGGVEVSCRAIHLYWWPYPRNLFKWQGMWWTHWHEKQGSVSSLHSLWDDEWLTVFPKPLTSQSFITVHLSVYRTTLLDLSEGTAVLPDVASVQYGIMRTNTCINWDRVHFPDRWYAFELQKYLESCVKTIFKCIPHYLLAAYFKWKTASTRNVDWLFLSQHLYWKSDLYLPGKYSCCFVVEVPLG